MTIPKVLVVYYSRTRRTERLAHAIGNSLEIRGLRCDLEPLHESITRQGFLGYLRSRVDSALGRTCPILPLTHKPEDYDVVVVGSPVWSGTVSNPVQSFLAANAGRLKNVALFLTHRAPQVAAVFAQMEALIARPAVAELTVRWPELISGDYKLEVRPFVEQIEHAAGSSVSARRRVEPRSALLH
jgi:menaquinone-dependent protoporphyrinogen IX oxidase